MDNGHGMKRFVLRTLLALLPAIALVALYLIKDPFHVIKPYGGNIYTPGDTVGLTVNTGYFSVESFKHFNPQRHYDSFIFGSSVSGYYLIKDWLPHLPQGSSAMHFNASRETLHGIINKLNYLTRHGVKINNALLVMEDEMLMRQPLDNDVIYVQHPQTEQDLSWWKFHQLYFSAFRHPELVAYTLWPNAATTRLVLDKGYATTDIPNRIEPLNEGYYRHIDSLIAVDPDRFYTPQHVARYSLPLKELPCQPKITPEVEDMLREIARILAKQGTSYQIIIPPHYGYESMHSIDLYQMESIFGEERVHNYSDDPKLGTDLHYYYDDGHLIASECAHLMDSAYHDVALPSPFIKR